MMWQVFGLRGAPDEEIAFVAHAKDAASWKVKKGRNKILDEWLANNPGHERVLLAKAKDRPTNPPLRSASGAAIRSSPLNARWRRRSGRWRRRSTCC